MRILVTVHHHLDANSGAPASTMRVAREFQRAGHSVAIASWDDLPVRLPERIKALVFPFYVLWRIAVGRLATAAPDVVDASSGDTWLVRTLLPRRLVPLLVLRSHGLEHHAHLARLESARRGELRLSRRYRLYHGGHRLTEVALSLRASDVALFLNSADRDYAVDQLGVEPTRTFVVPNGIADHFHDLPVDFDPPDGRLTIVQIGRYTHEKGVSYSAPALARVLERHPRVNVAFLGTHCPAERVRADFATRLWSRITVVPEYASRDLPGLLRNAHITVSPTLTEGFGVAIVEAMAAGLAPVVTATPGPLEVVENGRSGLIVPVRDSHAIERSLNLLLDDPRLLEKMRRRAHARAQAFAWPRIARLRLALYESILRGGASTAPRALSLAQDAASNSAEG